MRTSNKHPLRTWFDSDRHNRREMNSAELQVSSESSPWRPVRDMPPESCWKPRIRSPLDYSRLSPNLRAPTDRLPSLPARRHFSAVASSSMGSSVADGAKLQPSRAGSRLCVLCGERKAALKRPKTLEQVRLALPTLSFVICCDVLGNFYSWGSQRLNCKNFRWDHRAFSLILLSWAKKRCPLV